MKPEIKPIPDQAIELVKMGITLTAFSIHDDGRRQPWTKGWTQLDELPIKTEDDILSCIESGCWGFQFRAIDAGLIVLDVDVKSGKNGFDSLERSAKKLGLTIPQSMAFGYNVTTPNNGTHFYLKHEDMEWFKEKNLVGILEGVDVICSRKSLVTVSGSVGVQKGQNKQVHYVHGGHIKNIEYIPSSIFAIIKTEYDAKEKEKQRKEKERREAMEERRLNRALQDGSRIFDEANNRIGRQLIEQFFSEPGSYWEAGQNGQEFWTLNPLRADSGVGSFSIREDGIYSDFADKSIHGDFIDLMAQAYNMTPLDAAKSIIVNTGGNPDDYDTPKVPIDIISIMENARKREKQITKEDIVIDETSTGEYSKKMKVIFGNDLSNEYQPPDEIIEDMFVSHSVSVIYGDSNSGKTFFALSIACALSEGMPCYGKKVDQGIVVYLAVEAPETIKPRMQALKKYYNRSLSNLAMVPVPLNFYSGKQDVTDVTNLILEIERTTGKKVRMVIGDTLARMSAGANENSGEDMGPVMERFSLVAQLTGACVLVIHHTGKDAAKGARGWSGIRAHIDTEIEVTEKNKEHTAVITKQRALSSKNTAIPFKLEVIEMGISKFGSTATTCVAIPYDHKEPKKEDKKYEELKKRLFDAWEYSGGSFDLEGSPFIQHSLFKDYLVNVERKTEQSASQMLKPSSSGDIVNVLVQNGVIKKVGNCYIVTDLMMASKMSLKSRSEK